MLFGERAFEMWCGEGHDDKAGPLASQALASVYCDDDLLIPQFTRW
jgi:hypothetical protein